MPYVVGYPDPEVIASWPKPSPNPPYNGWRVPAVEIPFAVVAFAMGLGRFWFRKRSNTIGMDDWLMLAVVPPGILMLISTIMGTHYGAGYHIWDTKPEWTPTFQKLLLIFETSSIWAHAFCRLSLLFLYKRLFTEVRSYNLWINVGIWFNIVVLSGGFTAYMVQCVPIQAYWDWDYQPRKCTNSMIVLVTINVLNCIGYFYVFFLPLVPVSKINLPSGKKSAVVALFAVGFITCAVSTVKVAVSIVLFVRGDPTWVVSSLFILCNVEKSLTMICASVPACFRLIKSQQAGGKQEKPSPMATTSSASSVPNEEHPDMTIMERIRVWKKKRAETRAANAVKSTRSGGTADPSYQSTQDGDIEADLRDFRRNQKTVMISQVEENRNSAGRDVERGISMDITPSSAQH